MERTLIVPCAGKSTRFPNMKPKWLLTHPDGALMIEKALSGIDLDLFDRIIITIVKQFEEKYEALTILNQVFLKNSRVEFCVLEDFTSSASETVYLTIKNMNVRGEIVIKDSDNCVVVDLKNQRDNFIVGYDLHKHTQISNIPGKSFVIINEQKIVEDIIEKRIVSNIICLGIYGIRSAERFAFAFEDISKKGIKSELFVSHIISYLIAKEEKYLYIEAEDYIDWGTLVEWKETQARYKTYFIDVDGVILKNSGKYGSVNWSNNKEFLTENIKKIIELQEKGAQIVITTSRTEEYREDLEGLLHSVNIKPYAVIMGLNHAARVIINDFASTNPYPSGIAITLPRNGNISDYI